MKKWPWIALVLLIVALDQLSKYWAGASLAPYQQEQVFSWFNLTLAYNSGAAFSFLSGAGGWQRWLFTSLSLLMSVFFLVWLIRIPKQQYLLLTSVSFVLGGALGNLYDRAFYGYVIDFIQVHYQNYYWPVFNLADSAICIGAGLLFIALSKDGN